MLRGRTAVPDGPTLETHPDVTHRAFGHRDLFLLFVEWRDFDRERAVRVRAVKLLAVGGVRRSQIELDARDVTLTLTIDPSNFLVCQVSNPSLSKTSAATSSPTVHSPSAQSGHFTSKAVSPSFWSVRWVSIYFARQGEQYVWDDGHKSRTPGVTGLSPT